jgi:hypothetical protein
MMTMTMTTTLSTLELEPQVALDAKCACNIASIVEIYII